METIAKNLDREVKKGKLSEAEKPAVLGAAERQSRIFGSWRRRILWWRRCRRNRRSNARC